MTNSSFYGSHVLRLRCSSRDDLPTSTLQNRINLRVQYLAPLKPSSVNIVPCVDRHAAGTAMSTTRVSGSARRKSALGIISHDTKKHRRDQIFEDGFDFTLDATRKEMAKRQGGFDKTKVLAAAGEGGGGGDEPPRGECCIPIRIHAVNPMTC